MNSKYVSRDMASLAIPVGENFIHHAISRDYPYVTLYCPSRDIMWMAMTVLKYGRKAAFSDLVGITYIIF